MFKVENLEFKYTKNQSNVLNGLNYINIFFSFKNKIKI